MVAIIHFWRKNPIRELFDHNENPAVKAEMQAAFRRTFVPMIVYQLYMAPYHRYAVLDEEGRWEDDGGPGDRHHADDTTGYLRSFDLC